MKPQKDFTYGTVQDSGSISLDVSGNQVRLGVTAPREVPVHREEVAERIRAEGAQAVGLLYMG